MSFSQRLMILLLINLPLVGCDQYTKYLATKHLMGKPAIVYGDNWLRLEYAINPGGWGGLLGESNEWLRRGILTWGVLAGLIALAVFILVRKHERKQTIALSLILAGGLGNIIDRVMQSYVVDFLNVGVGSVLRTNIFNVADMVIMVGIGMWVWIQWREPDDASGDSHKGPKDKSDSATA